MSKKPCFRQPFKGQHGYNLKNRRLNIVIVQSEGN